MDDDDIGQTMYSWIMDLMPICRSLTGLGVEKTLNYIKNLLPDLDIKQVPSGTKVFDWTIPDEWNISGGYISNVDGIRLVDFEDSNLHIMGYSEPVNMVITREELESHLFYLQDQPTAIPYVTSYYKINWGFCLQYEKYLQLGDGPFKVVIDSSLSPGSLTYADLVIPGSSKEEVLFSTYVCHPSMANNELSGPVLAIALAKWLAARENLRYTYRFVFAPETIGAITYLTEHLEHLKEHVIAGWVLTCVGDDRKFSYLESRYADTLSDRVSRTILTETVTQFQKFTFLERGSDERQWCSPGVDLPMCSIMRSKYGTYAEYHTSLDNLDFVSARGLQGSFEVFTKCIGLLERNFYWKAVLPGEPQLGKRGLYENTSIKGSAEATRSMMNVLAYCDGSNDTIDLARITGLDTERVLDLLALLSSVRVITTTD